MGARAIRWEGWSLAEEADRRFRRILLRVGIPFLVLGLLVPYLQLAGLQEGGGELTGKRYVEFQSGPAPTETQTEEPPPQEPQPQPAQERNQAKPAPKQEVPPEVVQQQRVAQARAKAQQALAWTSQISGLARDEVAPRLADAPLETADAATGEERGSAIAAASRSTSEGIGNVRAAERRESGTALGAKHSARVENPFGMSTQRGRPGQGGDKRIAGRTLDEIQQVFDRNKGAFYALYTRALRDKEYLRGKVVLRLTIAPNGSVTECSIVSSELRDAELERKIVQRVRLLNFGAKDVPPFTYPNFPMYFFPQG